MAEDWKELKANTAVVYWSPGSEESISPYSFAASFAVPAKNRIGKGGDIGYQRLQQCLRVALPGKVCTLSCPEQKELRLRSFLDKDGKVSHKSALRGIQVDHLLRGIKN